MAEAALALCVVDPARMTGRCATRDEVLDELDREVRTLDGRAPFRR